MATAHAVSHMVDDFERDLTMSDYSAIQDPMIANIRNAWTKPHITQRDKRTPRITDCSTVDSGAMGPRYRTNQSEMGRDYNIKDNNPDRKFHEKTIDIAWRDVGSMGNVMVVIGSFVLLAWVFSQK